MTEAVSDIMTKAPYAIIAVSALWVGMDSHRNEVRTNRKKPYSLANGAMTWIVGCALIWILCFPYYLWARRGHMKETGGSSTFVTWFGLVLIFATLAIPLIHAAMV